MTIFSKAVVNGVFHPSNDFGFVSILSPSFQYGLTVFEGLRVYRNADGIGYLLLEEYIDRLIKSADLLGLKNLPPKQVVKEDIYKL